MEEVGQGKIPRKQEIQPTGEKKINPNGAKDKCPGQHDAASM